MNIILSPEHEIMSDEDRKLYYRMRQILDTFFLSNLKIHTQEEDHLYSNCFNRSILISQKEVKDLLEQHSQEHKPDVMLEEMVKNCADQFMQHLRNLLALQDEAIRRGIQV